MAVLQGHFRQRSDAGAVDATPTWAAAEDATANPGTSNFRLRFSIANFGDATASQSWQLYLSKNGAAYGAVTTSSTDGVKSANAGSDADETAIYIPRLSVPTGWWLSGAAIDLNFAGDLIYPGAITDYLSCSRASVGYARTSTGSWTEFASDTLRRTDLGLLIEDARTNYLLNSETPATQTTQSLDAGAYCLWVEGAGSALASGGTATITGAATATDGSPNIFTVTVGGTVLVTVIGSLDRFQLETKFQSSYIPTTSTSATRAADAVTLIGDAAAVFSANPMVGSIYADVGPVLCDFAETSGMVGNSGGGGSQLLYFKFNEGVFLNNDAVVLGALLGADYATSGVKVACGFDASGRSLVGNGGSPGTDAGTQPAISTPYVGGINVAGHYDYAYIRRLAFWTTRLADSTLQALTAS